MLSAGVLAPLALVCVWLGGWAFAVMLLAGFVGVVWEWGSMCRWRLLPLGLGLAYVGCALGSLLVLRESSVRSVFFVLLVVWSSDIGAYVAGRLLADDVWHRPSPQVRHGAALRVAWRLPWCSAGSLQDSAWA